MKLSYIEIEPPEPADGCIIWCTVWEHMKEFEPVVPHMHLNTVRFVFPQSLDLPVTINGGVEMPAWFDIRNSTMIHARITRRYRIVCKAFTRHY